MRSLRTAFASILALAICAGIGNAESGIVTLPIGEYIDRFLENSNELAEARDAARQARTILENAQAGQQSAYDLGLLENDYRFKQALVMSVENSMIVLAFERVFAATAAERALAFARVSEEIAAAAYERARDLLRKTYISVRQEREAHVSSMQSAQALRAAEDALLGSRKALSRSLGEVTVDVDPFDFSVVFPVPPELQLMTLRDAYLVKLRADLGLYRERRDFLGASAAFSQSELEGIEQATAQTQRLIQERAWSLEDELDQARSQLRGYADARRIAEMMTEIESIDLAEARHLYGKGEIYASDLTSAELASDSALEQLRSLERGGFLLVLQILSMNNVSLKEWVGERWP